MENYVGAVIIIGMCVIVLAIVAFRRRAEFFINFLLRGVIGTLAMYCANMLLAGSGLAIAVGINPVTILTSSILGFPGVLLLYGINFYKLL